MIHPFSGLRLTPKVLAQGETLCLPYDCLTPEIEQCLRKSPHNAIYLEEPRPSKKATKATEANEARILWSKWRSNGTLSQDRESYYFLVESFKGHKRIGLLGMLDLAQGQKIWPHERCYKKFIRQRKKHFLDTQLHLSPVFLVARDNRNELKEALEDLYRQKKLSGQFISYKPTSFDGVQRNLFVIDEARLIKKLERALARQEGFLIADGHHRYKAAQELYGENFFKKTLCYVTSSNLSVGLVKKHPPIGGKANNANKATKAKEAKKMPPLEEIIQKAKEGKLFPRKTTYFWPKVLCGLVYAEI